MTSAAKPAPLSKADFTAMAAIAKARKENLQTMFKGATIVYGKTSAVGSAKSIASSGYKIYSSAKALASTGAAAASAASSGGFRAQAQQMIMDAVGVDQLQDLIEVITSEACQKVMSRPKKVPFSFTLAIWNPIGQVHSVPLASLQDAWVVSELQEILKPMPMPV